MMAVENQNVTPAAAIGWFLVLICVAPPPVAQREVHAETDIGCSQHLTDKPLAEAVGPVGVLANLRGAPDSIRAVAKRLLAQALNDGARDGDDCRGCAQVPMSVVYRVAPIAYIDDVRQREVCLNLEEQTTKSPFVFEKKRFGTVDELNEWIMNFSRGKGTDGKELYRLCSSNCSPRYTFLINGGYQSGFSVESKVLCGRARDRSNRRYSLSTALRPHCAREQL